MTHHRFEFAMPAAAAVVFDAFHYHHWRTRWDSLVSRTQVEGGAPCPSVGAETHNTGAGLLRGLSMRTKFVSFDRPHLAAAAMVGTSFPFSRWAASMRHKSAGERQSVLIYTYSFEVGPAWLRSFIGPVVRWSFERQTRKRFGRLQAFLAAHGDEVVAWQQRSLPVPTGPMLRTSIDTARPS
ncbi:SRPBCC family protein [Variovorax sp. RT4R15]|uniref:SRPBCC family protein n=1 Tax=Variovorax sp. RT4R15 TaxID=3443737 RepID=UPI003F4864E3